MDKKDIITKMKLLKDYRQDKIKQTNGKVLNVKYLGNLSKNKDAEDNMLAIYLIIEQYLKDGVPIEVEQYYLEDLQNGDIKFLGGDNKSDEIQKIYLSDKYIEDKETRDYLEKALNEMDKIGELDLAEQEKLEQIAKELGIDIEEIESMAELDLDQEVKDKDNKEESQKDEEEKEQDDDELNQKETEKLTKVAGKQEVNINAKFDGKTPLRNELGLSGEYKSIMVVYSEKLKDIKGEEEKTNSSTIAFLAVKNDGTAEVINSLEPDYSSGTIPTKEAIKVDANGVAKQDRSTLSRYKIAGKNAYLSVQRGNYGEMKVYHGQKTKEENRSVEFQLETNSIRPTSKEMRDLQHPGKGEYNIDNIDNEFQEHVEHGEKELQNRVDYDGDENTATHVHDDEHQVEKEEITQIYVAEEIEYWAKEIMKDEDVQKVFTNEEVEKMIKNYWKKDKGNTKDLYSVEESKKEYDIIKSNIEKDAEKMRTK